LPVEVISVVASQVKLHGNIGDVKRGSTEWNEMKGVDLASDGHVEVETINVESSGVGSREELDFFLVEGDIVNVDVV